MSKRNIYVFAKPGYDSEAIALFSRMAVQPNATRKGLINDFIKGIKADLAITTLGAAFDCLWFTAAHDIQSSRLNWVKNAHDLTEVNSPNWNLDRGYAGNGTSMYLNTNYNPSTQGVNFIQNNGAISIYTRTNIIDLKVDMGNWNGTSGSVMAVRYNGTVPGDAALARLNSSVFSVKAAGLNSLGMFTIARENDSANIKLYKSSTLLDTKAASSFAPVNLNLYLLCWNVSGTASDFSTRQVSFACVRKGNINEALIYNRVQAFLTAIGAAV